MVSKMNFLYPPVINNSTVDNSKILLISKKKSEFKNPDFHNLLLLLELAFEDTHFTIFIHSFFHQDIWG
jgi:hypothetical protein